MSGQIFLHNIGDHMKVIIL